MMPLLLRGKFIFFLKKHATKNKGNFRFAWFGTRVSGIRAEDALMDPSGNSRTALGDQYAVVGGHA
jgi:hypothetical protein